VLEFELMAFENISLKSTTALSGHFVKSEAKPRLTIKARGVRIKHHKRINARVVTLATLTGWSCLKSSKNGFEVVPRLALLTIRVYSPVRAVGVTRWWLSNQVRSGRKQP
jgi:hypothetical protein